MASRLSTTFLSIVAADMSILLVSPAQHKFACFNNEKAVVAVGV